MAIVFYSTVKRPPKENFLTNTGSESITETAGYRSSKQMIQRLEMAGERLMNYRRGLYDFEHDVNLPENIDEVADLAFQKGMSIAEVAQMLESVNDSKSAKEYKEELEDKKENEKETMAPDDPPA